MIEEDPTTMNGFTAPNLHQPQLFATGEKPLERVSCPLPEIASSIKIDRERLDKIARTVHHIAGIDTAQRVYAPEVVSDAVGRAVIETYLEFDDNSVNGEGGTPRLEEIADVAFTVFDAIRNGQNG